MRIIRTTENDYLKATKQTAKATGKSTTTGAKHLSNEKHGERQEVKTYRRKTADGDYKLIYTA